MPEESGKDDETDLTTCIETLRREPGSAVMPDHFPAPEASQGRASEK